MEQNNNTLPAEVLDKINNEADLYGFVVPYDGSNTFYIEDKVKGYQAGATEWATKLHSLQVEFNNIRNANKRWEESFNMAQRGYDAAYNDLQNMKLERDELKERCDKIETALKQFISYHETGLLPDRFTYEKGVEAMKGEEIASQLLNLPEDTEPKGMPLPTEDPFKNI